MLPEIELITNVMIQSIVDWHQKSAPTPNPYHEDNILYLIYKKNQIDTVQWHIEDEIRRPDLPDRELIGFKRQIDKLNQERTDTVEQLDDMFFDLFKNVHREIDARMNSETPAWLLDRMSILELKIYHMDEQTRRTDTEISHINNCKNKLEILLSQRLDLQQCFRDLIGDLKTGKKFMKVYRQMKMYNDKKLNPSLYSQK